MRVLSATYGTRGDVEPVVGLAVRLRARGADVRVCAPPDADLAALVERAGVPLVPFARSWASWATEEATSDEQVASVDDFVRGYIDATYDLLAKAATECDVLVASGMLHFVAGTAAEWAGVPHHFVVFSDRLLGPQPWHAAVKAPIDAHRASLGLAPAGDVPAFLFTERPWVAADRVLSPPHEPADPAVVRTGAWVLHDERPLPADIEAFLAAGPPPVYAGFGSMRVRADAVEAAIAAIRAHGRRAVLGRGWADVGVAATDDVHVVGEVNQQALFARVAAVVHHGGAGTTATAARAGTPQVVVPQAADQPHWAARVAELGIGVAHDGPEPTRASLEAALTVALAPEAAARAAAVAQAMRDDAADEAASLLLGP